MHVSNVSNMKCKHEIRSKPALQNSPPNASIMVCPHRGPICITTAGIPYSFLADCDSRRLCWLASRTGSTVGQFCKIDYRCILIRAMSMFSTPVLLLSYHLATVFWIGLPKNVSNIFPFTSRPNSARYVRRVQLRSERSQGDLSFSPTTLPGSTRNRRHPGTPRRPYWPRLFTSHNLAGIIIRGRLTLSIMSCVRLVNVECRAANRSCISPDPADRADKWR